MTTPHLDAFTALLGKVDDLSAALKTNHDAWAVAMHELSRRVDDLTALLQASTPTATHPLFGAATQPWGPADPLNDPR